MGEQVLRLPCGTSNNHHGKLWRCGRLFWNYPMPSDSSTESVSSGTALSVPEEADVPPVSDLRPSSTADSVYPHRRRASSCRNVGNGGSQTGEKERLPHHTYLRSVPFPGIVYFSVSFLH
ncbi:uncharacterized protein LOC118193177 [Stegodyphus dumicola]|uniref:uncharacterized protein LOC118193177 n=1 Tax=Stegodyphus dumicola TaxID=202533 RepID=UPI0015B17436|nr:uncharacterized protein LOC118193177 [Stegodyphus dumicola]